MALKLVIFAPHQDDELNLFGTLFNKYLKSGFDVNIVFITNGDAYGLEKIRYVESEKLKKIFGITNIFYFGFSDSSVDNLTDGTIYNNDSDVYVSISNHSKTYKPYDDNINNYLPTLLGYDYLPYTRSSLLKGITEYLSLYRPEIIITTSWDDHPDHKIISAVLSEAILSACKKDNNYLPLYLEGFSYLGNWLGRDDFFNTTPLETIPDNTTNPAFPFKWDDRIQVFVDRKELSLCFWKSKLFKAFCSYSSQNGAPHFFRSANTDKCFWIRDTHNIALYSKIECSSGSPMPLNDFKLLDSNNIRNHDFSIKNHSLIHWSPSSDDLHPAIKITFPTPKLIKTIVIHQGYGCESFYCAITINNKDYEYIVDDYCYTIDLDYHTATAHIEIKIKRFPSQEIAIREIEVFDDHNNKYLDSFLSCSENNIYPKRHKLMICFAKVFRKYYLWKEYKKYKKTMKNNKPMNNDGIFGFN